jgi:acyl-CoA synthetase (AMP-forming)/AMP-acid ligase II
MPDFFCPLAQAANRYPDEPALIADHHVITYEQYDRLVSATASELHQGGVRAGERVAVVAENRLEYVNILMALFSPRSRRLSDKSAISRTNHH